MKSLGEFPGLLPGTQIEIWYMRPEFFRDFSFGEIKEFDPKNLDKTHIMLGTIGGLPGLPLSFSTEIRQRILNAIFPAMQGEFWGRDVAQANALVKARELGHSSMSVGDVVRFKEPTSEVYLLTYEKPGMIGVSDWRRF